MSIARIDLWEDARWMVTVDHCADRNLCIGCGTAECLAAGNGAFSPHCEAVTDIDVFERKLGITPAPPKPEWMAAP